MSNKIVLGLAFAALIVSCKDETKEKVGVATEAVVTDIKENVDSAKVKVENAIDSSKVKEKVREVVVKGAKKLGEAADEVKEAAEK